MKNTALVMQMLNEQISDRVKAIRKARGLTLAQASERAKTLGIKLSGSQISRLETGVIIWSSKHLETISAVFEVSPAELLPGHAETALEDDEEMLVLAWRRGGPAGLMGWLATQLPGRDP